MKAKHAQILKFLPYCYTPVSASAPCGAYTVMDLERLVEVDERVVQIEERNPLHSGTS